MPPEQKAALLRQAVEQSPDAAPLRFELGAVLAKIGKKAEAVAAFMAALDLEPAHFHALHGLTRVLLSEDDGAGALAACEYSLQRVPGNTPALATKSLVLLELNERAAAQQLLDFDSFVRILTAEIPAAYPNHESFLSTLVAAIHANPALEFEPRGRTARGGSRADLAPAPGGPESLVVEMLESATQQYRNALVRDLTHPFVAAAPQNARLCMWTNVLQERGYHMPHIHPGAWLSGVYYVKVPTGGAEFAGELELGCSGQLLRTGAPCVKRVCPEAGSLVLFPSYFYHGTIPTQGQEERISIAFDLVPV